MAQTYADYLKSERWATLSSLAKHLAGWRCRVCNGAEIYLETHHRSYQRIGKPDEIDDLTVLCADCHGIFHREGKIPQKPKHLFLNESNALRTIVANQHKAGR